MDDDIAQFTSITGATPERAAQYLQLSDGSLESAIQLFFESPDLGTATTTTSQPPVASDPTSGAQDAPIQIPSDDEDDDVAMVDRPHQPATVAQPNTSLESDEEMARRLQEEFYGSGGAGGRISPDDVRAPIARTTEQLVGPDAGWGSEPGDMRAAIAEQLMMRERARAGLSYHGGTR